MRNTISNFLNLGAVLLGLLLSPTSHAYFSTMDTGEVLDAGQYRLLLEPQVIVSKYEGFNILGRFTTGLREDVSVEGVVGFGEVDFQVGAFIKYVPFPDMESQPAVGGKVGVTYARVDGANELSVRLHPMVSKKFETEAGVFTPFASLPFGLTSRSSDTTVPVQVAAGSEWQTIQWKNLTFMLELGLNLHKSFSYISGGAIYYFDDSVLSR